MSYKKLCVFLLICAVASNALATNRGWIGGGTTPVTPGVPPGRDWFNSENWTPAGPIPSPGDNIIINFAGGNPGPIIGATGAVANDIFIASIPGYQDLTVWPAGDLTGSGHLWVGSGGAGSVGIMDISGTVNVGGMIGLGTIDAVNPSGGIGTVIVREGGLLALSNIHSAGTSIQPGSIIDISGLGLITLPGDFVSVVGLYVTAGKITAYGGTGTVDVQPVYDDFGVIIQTVVTAIPPSLTVLAPNGGEALIGGNIYQITWDTEGTVTDVLIEYSTNNGSAWTPVDPCNTGNTGSYNWLVPDVNSEQCLMWVADANDPNVNDTSDAAFTIYECTLTTDLTGDCVVNLYDLAALTPDWLKCGNPFDPNCD